MLISDFIPISLSLLLISEHKPACDSRNFIPGALDLVGGTWLSYLSLCSLLTASRLSVYRVWSILSSSTRSNIFLSASFYPWCLTFLFSRYLSAPADRKIISHFYRFVCLIFRQDCGSVEASKRHGEKGLNKRHRQPRMIKTEKTEEERKKGGARRTG